MDKIQELKERLRKLEEKIASRKQERYTYPSIEESFQDIGLNIRSSIPHIVVGGSKPSTNQKSMPISNPAQYSQYSDGLFNQKEVGWINRLKKAGLVAAVGAIVIYAVWRVLFG